jgi:hypothetical protein
VCMVMVVVGESVVVHSVCVCGCMSVGSDVVEWLWCLWRRGVEECGEVKFVCFGEKCGVWCVYDDGQVCGMH